MFKILTLNKISKVGLATLPDTYTVSDDEKNPDGILLRSFKMHDMELPDSLKAVARCGAGVNNIPLDKCAEKGIVVFNTPGANANAVKELVLTALLISSRKIIDSYNWAQSLAGTEGVAAAVEKGKSAFVGPEITGKTLGIIGLGAIGALVANAAVALGMTVVGYDPFLSVAGALRLDPAVKIVSNIDDLYAASDYITIHVPFIKGETENTICKETLAKCKDNVRIINLARGELVNTADIKEAIESGKVYAYVTDFPNEAAVGVEGIITLPHLGASTPEAEDNCAVMAAKEMQDYLENGNITNSVNFPAVTLNADKKVCVLHKNVEDIVAKVTAKLSNVNASVNKVKGNYGYAMFDAEATDIAAIEAIDGVIAVRTIG